MNFTFTPKANNNDIVLTLDLVKEYLRIEDSVQDVKIQSLIDQCVSLFQTKTAYIFREGSLDITFSIKDNVLYRKRKVSSFADRFVGDSYRNLEDFYLTDLGANISTQKPTSLIYTYDCGEQEMTLTADQLRDSVPDNFFIVTKKFPLMFKLPRDLSDLNALNFNRFDESTIITCKLLVGAIVISDDVKGCIIRMVSQMFENPDMDLMMSDNVIQSTIANYNFRIGL